MVMTLEEVMRAPADIGSDEHGQRSAPGTAPSSAQDFLSCKPARCRARQILARWDHLFALRYPAPSFRGVRRALHRSEGCGLSRAGRADSAPTRLECVLDELASALKMIRWSCG